jgi:hypothetical protein
MLRGAQITASALVLAGVLSACAGRHFDGQVYRDDNVAFQVGPVPSGFSPISSDESLLAWNNRSSGAMIALSARCHRDGDDIPLEALVQHLFIQLTDRETLRSERFQLDGREALESELTARLDGVPRHFLVVVLKKDGCVYDQVYVDRGGDDPALVRSRAEFRAMARGFRTL